MNIRGQRLVRQNSGGFYDVLRIALPLILASSCHALNMFVDRLMLAHYSAEAVSAAFTGGLTNFTIACLFTGTISYAGTFVAQYEGAKQPERIGATVWQAVFLALAGGALLSSGIWWAKPLFSLFHHDVEITRQEVLYFQILSGGLFVFLTSCAFSCFWTGRGRTWLVLGISGIITLLNIPFNYVLIFGWGPLPELGVAGAAWGTILSELVGVFIYLPLFLSASSHRHYETRKVRLDWELLGRMIRYGFPNGVQMALDLIAFNTFCIVLGCYGVAVMEAASITFGINNIAFCPVMGIGQTASILVGQAVGARDVKRARRSAYSALLVVTIYNVGMIILFGFFQNAVLAPFVRPGDPAQARALELAGYMLHFICAYLLFDGVNLTFSNALRGAGDTRFTMVVLGVVGVLCFALPCVIFFNLGWPWWSLWIVCDLEILLLCTIYFIRFRKGKWEKMRVIEEKF